MAYELRSQNNRVGATAAVFAPPVSAAVFVGWHGPRLRGHVWTHPNTVGGTVCLQAVFVVHPKFPSTLLASKQCHPDYSTPSTIAISSAASRVA
jgi:hypothetical protein